MRSLLRGRLRPPVLVTALLAALVGPTLAAPPAHAAGTITVEIQGKGRVSGSGIDCTEEGGTCSVSTSQATLTAAPSAGYGFTGWQGCSLPLPLLNTCSELFVGGDKTITATFEDVQAPATPQLDPAGGTVGGSLEVTATTSDNSGTVDRVVFSVEGSKYDTDSSAPFDTQITTTVYQKQSITVGAVAYDAAGNASSLGTATYTVDATPPETVIKKGPPKRVVTTRKRTPVDFVFGSDEKPVTYECSLYGGGFDWKPCGRKHTYRLKPGRYELWVHAIDAAGTEDPSFASHKWRIVKRRR